MSQLAQQSDPKQMDISIRARCTVCGAKAKVNSKGRCTQNQTDYNCQCTADDCNKRFVITHGTMIRRGKKHVHH